VETELPGHFQMLYYDDTNGLQCTAPRWEKNWAEDVRQDYRQEITIYPTGRPQGALSAGNADMYADVLIHTKVIGHKGIPVASGLEMGELTTPDPNRPSLLLRKFNEGSLWELAKEVGTTVDTILAANHLQTEPDRDQILLIPIP
jgi:hypothetical protein